MAHPFCKTPILHVAISATPDAAPPTGISAIVALRSKLAAKRHAKTEADAGRLANTGQAAAPEQETEAERNARAAREAVAMAIRHAARQDLEEAQARHASVQLAIQHVREQIASVRAERERRAAGTAHAEATRHAHESRAVEMAI